MTSQTFPATQGDPTAFPPTPVKQELPIASPQVDSLHLQRGAMPCWLQDSYIKKDNPLFLWTPCSFCSLRASQIPLTPFCYLSCQKELSSTKISIPSKRHFLVNLTMKRRRFVWPPPFGTQGLRCLQLTVLEDTAAPKTPMGIEEATEDLTQCCLDLHIFKPVVLTDRSPEDNQSQGGRSLTGNEEILVVLS